MLEFDTCVGCGELPIGFRVVGISIVLPNGDFVYECPSEKQLNPLNHL